MSNRISNNLKNSIVNPSEPGVLLFWNFLSASAHSFIVNKPSQRPASSLFKVLRFGESKKCTESFVSASEIFFDLYTFLKKFSSSASICLAFRRIEPSHLLMPLYVSFCGFFSLNWESTSILFTKFIPTCSASNYCSLGFFCNYFPKFTFHTVYFSFFRFVKWWTDLFLQAIEFF